MPCLILTGHPCAGKTTTAGLLKERALKHRLIDNVVLINEESACPQWSKTQCFESPLAEKKTRAALKAAFDRSVGGNAVDSKTLVILDSSNYIKGFRYELFCISKAAGEKHGVLWVLNHHSILEAWNKNRSVEQSYDAELLKELVTRYEPPDARNRWDKPLYKVDLSQGQNTTHDAMTDALKRSVYNMHDLEDNLMEGKEGAAASSKSEVAVKDSRPVRSAFQRTKKQPTPAAVKKEEKPGNPEPPTTAETKPTEAPKSGEPAQVAESKPLEEQLDNILEAFLVNTQALTEGMSTRQNLPSDANALQNMDAITRRLVSSYSAAQTNHTGGKLIVSYSGKTYTLNHKRTISLPELRRLHKQYLRWVVTHPPPDTSEDGITVSFLTYIESQI